jgi:hypothetical protein
MYGLSTTRLARLPAALGAALLAAAAAPASARAEAVARGRAVTVLGIDGFELPSVIEMAPVRYAEHVTSALEAAGWRVVPAPMGAADLSVALDCAATEPACVAKMAAHLGVDAVVLGEVRADGPIVWLDVRLLAAASGAPERTLHAPVPADREGMEDELLRLSSAFVTGVPGAGAAVSAVAAGSGAGARTGRRLVLFPAEGAALSKPMKKMPERATKAFATALRARGWFVLTAAAPAAAAAKWAACPAADAECMVRLATSASVDAAAVPELRPDGTSVVVRLRVTGVGARAAGGGVPAEDVSQTIPGALAGLPGELVRVAAEMADALTAAVAALEPVAAVVASPLVPSGPALGAVAAAPGTGAATAGRPGASAVTLLPGFGVAAVGAALIVAAIPSGYRTRRLNAEWEAAGHDDFDDIAALRTLEGRGKGAAVLTDVLLGVGLAAVGVGVAVVIGSWRLKAGGAHP